jgi:hypothetical protein
MRKRRLRSNGRGAQHVNLIECPHCGTQWRVTDENMRRLAELIAARHPEGGYGINIEAIPPDIDWAHGPVDVVDLERTYEAAVTR